MSANVGTIDRVIRFLLGAVLIAMPFASGAALFDSGAALYGFPVVGAILVLTSLFRFCPLYRLIGVRTCRA
jgi:hypothetical protein